MPQETLNRIYAGKTRTPVSRGEEIGEGIQVEVNPSEDEYLDEDVIEQSFIEPDGSSQSSSYSEPDLSQKDNIQEQWSDNDTRQFQRKPLLDDASLEELEGDHQVQMLIQWAVAAENNQMNSAKAAGKSSKSVSKCSSGKVSREANRNNNKVVRNLIKSPSDTTLYRPALQKEDQCSEHSSFSTSSY